MIRFLLRSIHYLGAFLNGRLDEVMDPRVQIEQAIGEARRQHGLLSEQAAAVIANQRELEIKISRSQSETDRLRRCAEQALLLADRARKSGDEAKAASHEATARVFANQLAAVESAVASLTDLHGKAIAAAGIARRAVEQNAFVLQQQLTERMAAALTQVNAVGAGGNVPTLADVRDRIDARVARATGRGELAAGSVDARLLDTERSVIDHEGETRLEEIRRGLGLEAPESE